MSGTVVKSVIDASGNIFSVDFWDDGSGNLKAVHQLDPTQLITLATASAQQSILAALGGALITKAVSLPATSHSSSIQTAGVAQDLMQANSGRSGWYIQNQSRQPLYVRSKGSAGTTVATLDNNSILVPAGEDFTPPKNSLSAWSIIGGTASQVFYCEEW